MSALIEARAVTRVLVDPEPFTLVDAATLKIEAGALVAIVGPSGCGKSSLLYLLGLLDRPDQGEVLIAGQPTTDLGEAARTRLRLERIGYVFQFHFLLPGWLGDARSFKRQWRDPIEQAGETLRARLLAARVRPVKQMGDVPEPPLPYPPEVIATLDELRTEEIVYPGDPDPRDALLADVHAAHIQALARAATAERERDALREQIGSAAATLATDAVKEPLALDISGPKKDEAAIRRFVASSSFAVVLETVTATARLRLRRDLSAWCKKQADERLVDLFDGVEPEKAEGFAEAMTAIIAHLGSLK